MTLKNALQLLECALSVSNKDGKHFAHEPIPISCGHSICKACVPSNNDYNIKCSHCGELNKLNLKDCKESFTTKLLFENFLSDLYPLIQTNFKKTLKKLKASISTYEELIEDKIENIKEDIETRVEALKDELDVLKEKFNEELERIKLDVLEYRSKQVVEKAPIEVSQFDILLKKLTKESKTSKAQTSTAFFYYQKNLLEMKHLIEESQKVDFTLKFVSSTFKHSLTQLGNIEYLNREQLNSRILQSHYEMNRLLKEICEWDPTKLELKLLYRGSKHGFQSSDFHNHCDDHESTLVLAKATRTGYIFGGYTSRTWNEQPNDLYKSDLKAFIFSFKNSYGIPLKFNISEVDKAIYCGSSWSCAFGAGADLFIFSNCNLNKNNYANLGTSYKLVTKLNEENGSLHIDMRTLFAGSFNFTIEDVEVFNVKFL
jgi:gas vesicle protein